MPDFIKVLSGRTEIVAELEALRQRFDDEHSEMASSWLSAASIL